MKSPLPKVLHPVAGVPILTKVIKAAKDAGADEIRVVVGYGEDLVRAVAVPMGAVCFKQQKQLGTADAVRAAVPATLSGVVLILNGDHPLIEARDIENMVNTFHDSTAHVAVMTVTLDEPGNYGRIVRHNGGVRAIVEARDAGPDTKKIREVNTGMYVTRAETLAEFLPQIKAQNSQKEFYLTDLVGLASEAGKKVEGISVPLHVSRGINTQQELSACSKELFQRKIQALMTEGVMVVEPSTVYVEDSVKVAAGTLLFPNVFLRGKTRIEARVVIEPGCMIKDSIIGEDVKIKAGCYVDSAVIGNSCEVGPFAHLRPGTELGVDCRVGNFVEMKKVKFGDRSKASHLTYLGDAKVGTDTNIGCGTITCNYATDHKKYETVIGNGVFVGSDSQFVAPVTIGDGAVIGSGSTITKSVPAGALAVTRASQMIRENYQPKGSKDSK